MGGGAGPQSPEGSVNIFQRTPWTHLNCYKLLCTIPDDNQTWEIGVTDAIGPDIVKSASGARLYVNGPPAKARQAQDILLRAVSLLPETDIDREAASIQVEWGGEVKPWGRIPNVSFHVIHGIPTDPQLASMTVEEGEEALHRSLNSYSQAPNNSQIRETLAKASYVIARKLTKQSETGKARQRQ